MDESVGDGTGCGQCTVVNGAIVRITVWKLLVHRTLPQDSSEESMFLPWLNMTAQREFTVLAHCGNML